MEATYSIMLGELVPEDFGSLSRGRIGDRLRAIDSPRIVQACFEEWRLPTGT